MADTTIASECTEDSPLTTSFTFFYSQKQSSVGRRTQASYESSIKEVGTVGTVGEFWSLYRYLVPPANLELNSDYHVFREGIRPLWEDEHNRQGGKWILRLKKGLVSKYWEGVLLMLVGEQFNSSDSICGAVVSIRYQEDIISVWNSNAFDREQSSAIRDDLFRVLELPEDTVIEYKKHDDSIRDNSSFRNTVVR